MRPLEGLTIVDFSQFLAGPSASLRLSDMGARVLKIEKPGTGDIGRQVYMCDLHFGEDSLLFHATNRDKLSIGLDLKNPEDLEQARNLIRKADIMIQNFRPGVIERLGLGYEEVSRLNPRLIYASVSGYGRKGPWHHLPGQDLLAQSRSGLAWLSGNMDDPPIPIGVSIIDMFTGAHLVQGILAALVNRQSTGKGALVEVSLLESALDLQFELISVHLNDGGKPPVRSAAHNGNAYLAAPYGIYPTKDGYLALAMNSIVKLAECLHIPELLRFDAPKSWFTHRDEIKFLISARLREKSAKEWQELLEPPGIWCAEVLHWKDLFGNELAGELDLVQDISNEKGDVFQTTRCPIRFNGEVLRGKKAAPAVGEHTHLAGSL